MPRKSLLLFLAVLFLAAVGVSRVFSQDDYAEEMATFRVIMHQIRKNYVKEVETKDLFKGAYRGMLSTLDPYSQYFDPVQTVTFSQDTEGQFGGLGIEITTNDGILTVVSPIRHTPAYDAGVMAGDRILEVDGKSTEGMDLTQAVSILRGKVGTAVVLTVRHLRSPVDTKITITRALIKPSAADHKMIDPVRGIGLLRVSSFNARAVVDLRRGLREMREEGMKGVILDLRQNPGGLLDKAVEMSDVFLEKGIIVSIKPRHPEFAKVYRARDDNHYLEAIPLVVLVNGGSASASEIVAAALRDNRRALLLGSRTYGKGSVQNLIPLANGQVLKLTTARYYTPADKPIEDRKGITPDIIVPMSPEHRVALRNQEREDKLRGHDPLLGLIGEGPSDQADNDKDKDEAPKPGGGEETRRERRIDYQLQAAVNILRWQVAGTGNNIGQ